jgi:NAD+ diphosphatase
MPLDLLPQPRLGYVGSAIERAAGRRDDAAFIAALKARPDCATYAIGGELIVLKKASDSATALFGLEEAARLGSATETIFLGLLDGAGRFGYALDPAAAEALKGRGDLLVTDLRSIAVQGLVDAQDLAALAEAKALLHWHARHRFCSNCGAETQLVQGGWRRDCARCNGQHFPRTDPVVIMLASRGDRCLLGRQSRFAPGMWSCLAGFMEPGESIEEAVRRETLEETGVVCGEVRYFRSQPWPFPSSLMIGCHAQALSEDIVVDRAEMEDARWFTRAEAIDMLARRHPGGLTTPPPVAIAHHIIRAWVEGEGF